MYIVFGYGGIGKQCIELLGAENIAYVVDNDDAKRNLKVVPAVYTFAEKKQEIKQSKARIVVAVSSKYQEELIELLVREGICQYALFSDLLSEQMKQKILHRPNYIRNYERAIQWIKENTILSEGIIVNSQYRVSYPEVTGYYIPTLLRWGHRDLAIKFAKWLCLTQKNDGSWFDAEGKAPYVFDSAQILKGLIAVRKIMPEVDDVIRHGCDWILSNMKDDGRLTTPTKEAWGNPNICSEIIHVYCLAPLVDAGTIFGEEKYAKAAQKILKYYLENHREEIEKFSLLSHFYAYVMEGLIDMGREDVVRRAMKKMAAIQKSDGSVPGYNNVNWVCSTGLFQLALVWFRLGELDCGNRAFSYACKLQNESGGWYGSYIHPDYSDEDNSYFPASEISWAVKYFLDALYWKNIATFNEMSNSFLPTISKDDGRYVLIREQLKDASFLGNKPLEILDIGCGKGRYLRNLAEDSPMHRYYAVDLSEKVMSSIPLQIVEKRQGSLTSIPYEDKKFDVVYACESLEHAIDIGSAIREMARVVTSGGRIIIVDKSKTKFGMMEIEEWEQWFDEDELKRIMSKYCSNVEVVKNIEYEGDWVPGLFSAWIGTVKH